MDTVRQRGFFYEAKLKTQNQEEHSYIGLTEGKFSDRYSKHLSSFEVKDPRNSTSLSKKVGELNRKHILFDIEWKIIQEASPYNAGSLECRLFILEIYHILFRPAATSLNSRNELTNKCRHPISSNSQTFSVNLNISGLML